MIRFPLHLYACDTLSETFALVVKTETDPQLLMCVMMAHGVYILK
jgi:hypothetical protein